MRESFSFSLVALPLAVVDRIGRYGETPHAVAVVGFLWAGSLITSGLIANADIGPAVELYATHPLGASMLWSATESVSNGIGGVFALLVSIGALRSRALPPVFNYAGFRVGTLGLISAVPGLHDLGAAFGITQIVWFV